MMAFSDVEGCKIVELYGLGSAEPGQQGNPNIHPRSPFQNPTFVKSLIYSSHLFQFGSAEPSSPPPCKRDPKFGHTVVKYFVSIVVVEKIHVA